MADLPEWVWQLVDELDRYDQEHPPLYRSGADAFERTECPCLVVKSIIPTNVQFAAEASRVRRRNESATRGPAEAAS